MQKSLDRYVGILCEARKKKGMTEQQARDSLQDMNVFGTLMVLAGDADGMVSGATSTTANTIRPALQVSRASLCVLRSCMNNHACPASSVACPAICLRLLEVLRDMPNPSCAQLLLRHLTQMGTAFA